jgi:hypothetical protein
MLISYQQRARLLCGDETFKWLRDGDLTTYINEARNQVAGESESVVTTGQLSAVPGSGAQQYPFSALVLPAAAISGGVGLVLNVRQGSYLVGEGQKSVYPRSWPWFQLYILNQPLPEAGPPHEFSQQGQGQFGTLWLNLLDTSYTLQFDVVCLPTPLVSDTTAEAIPLLWTIAVPYYAAWLALMSHPAPQMDPEKMFERYQQMMQRARGGAVSQVLPHIQSQGQDIANANRYGLQQGRG